MTTSLLITLLLAFPLAASLGCLLVKRPERIILTAVLTVLVLLPVGLFVAVRAMTGQAFTGWGYNLDALAGLHLALMYLVFGLSSLYALSYFRDEIAAGRLHRRAARRFGTLWPASLSAMTLVLVADNLGVMWVGMETTTLVTAFLICIERTPEAMEAMWKYLIICSVGIAFAFLGTLLVNGAAMAAGVSSALRWTELMAGAPALDATLIKVAFIFSLVGYGTKAGLAPMHTWLPDAHSQSPAPVSAMFSGFMINAALYCVMRHAAVVNAVLDTSVFTDMLFKGFGMASLIIAAAFIIFQNDLKRLLAYCSVEHMGVICLGLGLGHAGIIAALLHTVYHSLAKSLGFFSAGRLVTLYGTHDMRRITGALHAAPLWGACLLVSLLALTGTAPFAIFISEFLVIKAAINARAFCSLGFLAAGTCIAFIAILRRALFMCWGTPTVEPAACMALSERLLFIALAAVLLILGLWLPGGFMTLLDKAAYIAGGLS